VHLWAVALDRAPASLERLGRTLAPDERSRAAAFHFERDRSRFIVARSALRAILAHYSGQAPERLIFRYGRRGKPVLDDSCGGASIRFNLSHSHGLALCAVARDRDVGVDVERVRRELRVEAIVERFFSEREKAAFRALGAEHRQEAFFRCWTRKEAYQKSRGEGFFRSPGGFTVSVPPDDPPRLIEVDGEPGEAARWTLEDLRPAPDYVGSVIAEGQGWTSSRWSWTPRPWEADRRRTPTCNGS
jgi:4'-phosphopantetheinyl transferase